MTGHPVSRVAGRKKAAKALGGQILDVVVVTDVRSPQATYEEIRVEAQKYGLPVRNVLAPGILRITTETGVSQEENLE